jgi:hypothetical protein
VCANVANWPKNRPHNDERRLKIVIEDKERPTLAGLFLQKTGKETAFYDDMYPYLFSFLRQFSTKVCFIFVNTGAQ